MITYDTDVVNRELRIFCKEKANIDFRSKMLFHCAQSFRESIKHSLVSIVLASVPFATAFNDVNSVVKADSTLGTLDTRGLL